MKANNQISALLRKKLYGNWDQKVLEKAAETSAEVTKYNSLGFASQNVTTWSPCRQSNIASTPNTAVIADYYRTSALYSAHVFIVVVTIPGQFIIMGYDHLLTDRR